MTTRCFHVLLSGTMALAACGGEQSGQVDGGSVDAAPPDAAEMVDGAISDAGEGADAIGNADAIANPDAAGNVDANANPDAAGDPDASLAPDASAPPIGAIVAPPYLMWMTRDAVSVRWETADPSIGTVTYGPSPALEMSASESAAVTTHEIRLTNLAPGQKHYYQIRFDGYALPVRSFVTAPPAGGDPGFRFLVWGDNQDGVSEFETIVTHMIAEDAAFAVAVGDTVQGSTRANYRGQLLGPISPLADHVPFLVGRGNHEGYTEPALFEEYFSQPADEHCFGWRWGELFVMFIDTELAIDPGTPQSDCIEAALTSAEATGASFRAAVFHKPPRIEWWVGGPISFPAEMEAPWIRETLEPMLEGLGVDIVFNGHNHLYAHTPETPGGITWVTTGGGGGAIDTSFFLWAVGDWPAIETTIHQHHFLSVDVTATAMTVTAINIDGDPIHQFTITP